MSTKTTVAQRLEKLEYAEALMRALAHRLRIQILEFIHKEGQTHVQKIYRTLDLEQSITSQHLAIMRKVGLLHCRKEGKFKYYSVNYDLIERAVLAVDEFVEREEKWMKSQQLSQEDL